MVSQDPSTWLSFLEQTNSTPDIDVPTPKRSGEWEDLSEYEKDNVITVLTIMISSLVLWVTVPSLGALLDENIRECMDRSVYKRLVYLLLSLTVPACLALFFTFGRLVANCLGWYLGRDDRLGWNWEMLGSPSDEVLPCERA